MEKRKINYSKLDHAKVLANVFHPRKEHSSNYPSGSVNHAIPVDEGIVIGGRFYCVDPTAPHILFFHGNGEIVSDYNDVGPIYNSYGLNFLTVDYRGYGKSNGNPTVTSMIRDAHVIFSYVRKWLENKGRVGPLIVMGRSLGIASALELASHYESELAGLIIESGFAYTIPLLNFLGIDTHGLGITESDGFGHVEKIACFSKPTLIIHAEFDQFIPRSDAEILLKTSPARKKEFMMVPSADHNTILMMAGRNYFEKIENFILKIAPGSGEN